MRVGQRGSDPGNGVLSLEEMAEARVLWETTELTAEEIAARFRTEGKTVTKNAIISHAHRGKWNERRPQRPPRGLFDRLAELHEEFNRKTYKPPGYGYVRGPGAPLR